MATARDICTRALRKARITPFGEAPATEDMDEALTALNMMLAAWKLDKIDISHVALTLASTFPIADEFEEGTVYLLARRLDDSVAYPPTFDALDFLRKIQAEYATVSEVTFPKALTLFPSSRFRYP